MRKFLSIFTVTATLIGITSCSKSEIPDTAVDTDQPVEIRVAGKALSITPSTRVPFEGSVPTNLKARVLASNTAAKYINAPDDLIKDGTMSFNAASTAYKFDGTDVITYPHATTPVYLVGLYPTTTAADWTVDASSGSKASFVFNGTHDVMATREVATTREEAVAGTYQTLTFHHLLTRLNLRIQAENAAAQAAWGQVKSIKVKSLTNKATVTFGTEDNLTQPVTEFSVDATSTDTDFKFYTIETDNPIPQADIPLKPTGSAPALAVQSYSLVTPKDGSSTTQVSYDLVVETENHSGFAINVPLETTTSSEFKDNTKGLQFEITLTFTATEIKAMATVKPWVPGGTGSGTVQ